ncbi:lysozyme [bacterium]|nr:lysozyme [bacterium]
MGNTADLIAQYEGFSAEPYWDHSQWSIGYGSYAGSRDRNNRPNTRVTQAQGRDMLQQQMPRYEATVDKYDSTYNWTPAERQALTSFAYNVGSIDQLTDNGRRSRAEIAAAMPLYNKASQQVVPGLVRRRAAETAIFTGGEVPATSTAPAPMYSGPGASSITGGSDAPLPNAEPGTNFDTAESLSDIVTQMENAGEWWYNALDEYQNYTYNLELLIVDAKDAADFMVTESTNIGTIISNGWPGSSVKYLTIAETAVTTEFNIQDLEITSVGAGSNSTSKLAGTSTNLSFSIVQAGNTSLADNLMNAALLFGYSSISESKYFMKVNFKGYAEDDSVIRSENQNLTKVFPFIINNIGDVGGGTDARGTITAIEGTIAQDVATSLSVNQVVNNFEFVIQDTLQETLESFIDALNENIRKNDFSTDDPANNSFVHDYKFEFDKDFATKYAESKMNGELPHTGSANNTVAVRTGGINISEQIGTVSPGLSIIDIIYDICIQSLDIKTELLAENDTFTEVITILPTAVPRPGGRNVLSGEAGHEVTYYITTKPLLVVQNHHDNANKVRNSGKMIKEIFDNKRCRKVYYHQFTGMNDQILDLTLSFNRQLIKSYNLPTDAAFARRFMDGTASITESLNPRAQAHLETMQGQVDALTDSQTEGLENVSSIRDQIENSSEGISNDLITSTRASLAEQGIDPAFRHQIAHDMQGKPLEEQIRIAQQYDSEFVNSIGFTEEREKYNKLVADLAAANQAGVGQDRAQQQLARQRDNVIAQAMGANFSRSANAQLTASSEDFRGSAFTSSNSNQIIMEELGDDLISRLTTQQLEDIIDAMLLNPVIFKRSVLPHLTAKSNTVVFSSSDEEEIMLAKAKFYEAVNMDISMAKMKMTIKGDPYWIDTYLTPKNAKDVFGTSNGLDDYKSHPTTLNGPNYVTLVVNKAAGVDEFDNTKIAQLATMLYAVKNIVSIFSGGQFTQQLEMIRIPVPDSFLPINPFFGTSEIDTSAYTPPSSFGTPSVETSPSVVVPAGILPEDVPNPTNLPIGGGSIAGEDEFGNIGVELNPDGAPIAIGALNSLSQNLLENDGIPTQEQADQYDNTRKQVEYYCAQGSTAACTALQTADRNNNIFIVQNIAGDGPPYDVNTMVADINEAGIPVSPGGIAIIQQTMLANGGETFNADDIDGITQVEVDAYTQGKDDAAAAYYIGTNGIIENPSEGLQSNDTIDITGDPFVPNRSAIKVMSDTTGGGMRSVDTEIPANTLTPIEYEKARAIQQEIRTKLSETSIVDMTAEEYAEVKTLESAVNGMVTEATTGERGELLDGYNENKRLERVAVLEAQKLELEENLDSWYWKTVDRTADEAALAEVQAKLAAEEE